MKSNEIKYVKFMGIKIDNIDYEGVCEKLRDNIYSKGYICLTDVGNVIRSSKDTEFHNAINESLISIADGMPLAWYAKLLGCRKIKRISGMELFGRLLKEKNGFYHFLLGDTDQTLKKIICKAKQANNKIRIKGYSPPFKDCFDKSDNKTIIDKINKSNPDIVWVSFGGGKQEKWMYNNIHKLNKGIMIGVGAAFKFYLGVIKTPPRIIQYLGLQWFTRILQNPERLRSYLKANTVFIYRFLYEVVLAKKSKYKLKAHPN